jgi:hypothetical protein
MQGEVAQARNGDDKEVDADKHSALESRLAAVGESKDNRDDPGMDRE